MQTKRLLDRLDKFTGLYEIQSTFTHRMRIGNKILRGNPEDRNWGSFNDEGHCCWRGNPPKGWDENSATLENFTHISEVEIDYS